MLAMAVLLCALPLAAQNNGTPKVSMQHAVAFAVSPPVRDLPDLQPTITYGFHETEPPRRVNFHPGRGQLNNPDPALQTVTGNPDVSVTLGMSVEGINNLCGCYPPDTNAAVGDTQIVEWVNLHYAVYDKATGALLKGPLAGNTLFTALGGPCASNNEGDPIALFDKVHHVWFLSQFKVQNPAYFCVAVSTSNDATGTYYLYAFTTVDFNDYPKWGMWPTGYFGTDNHFNNSGSAYLNARLHALNDVKMRAGDPSAEHIEVQLSANDYSILPADVDSPTPPPAGQPEFFIGSYDVTASNNQLFLYSMAPDFTTGQAVVTGSNLANPITVPTYTPFCDSSRSCVPQLGTTTRVDALGDRLMYRFVYWEDPPIVSVKANPPIPLPQQHWWVNHTNTANGVAGVRWYEFAAPIKKVDTTALYLRQSGTFAPADSQYRWMASQAQDKMGNLALAYSISSSTMYPSINLVYRGVLDPLGQVGNETVLTAGTGSESATGSRWGDYSSISLDPSDHCTMWATQEYFTTPAGGAAWHTKLNQFKFSNCN